MDKSAEHVDKFATSSSTSRSSGSPEPAVAQTGDSTRGGTLGDRRPSRPSRAVEEGRTVFGSSSRQLTERVLLRGYGLDPDDLERSLIERGGKR